MSTWGLLTNEQFFLAGLEGWKRGGKRKRGSGEGGRRRKEKEAKKNKKKRERKADSTHKRNVLKKFPGLAHVCGCLGNQALHNTEELPVENAG